MDPYKHDGFSKDAPFKVPTDAQYNGDRTLALRAAFTASVSLATKYLSLFGAACVREEPDPDPPNPGARQAVTIVVAIDPNDLVGSPGVAAARWVNDEQPLKYAIYFENKPDATSPAADVIVTDQLDVANMDLSTFSLGPIAFGGRQVIPPPGLSQFSTDVDLRPGNNLIIRINAGLDKATGLVTWRFTSLDPATKLPTSDPLAGFLPPNVTPPQGDGSVLFTINAEARPCDRDRDPPTSADCLRCQRTHRHIGMVEHSRQC